MQLLAKVKHPIDVQMEYNTVEIGSDCGNYTLKLLS